MVVVLVVVVVVLAVRNYGRRLVLPLLLLTLSKVSLVCLLRLFVNQPFVIIVVSCTLKQ